MESNTWYFHLLLLFPLCLFDGAERQAPQKLRKELCTALSADLMNYLVTVSLRKMKGVADDQLSGLLKLLLPKLGGSNSLD